MVNKKELSRQKRHRRIRLNMTGTVEKPRLVVRRSLNNFSAQAVDDVNVKTIISISTMDKDIRQNFKSGGNIKAAEILGQLFSSKLKEKGITKIVFDRAGFLYHGRIKAFAEALRKGGLEF